MGNSTSNVQNEIKSSNSGEGSGQVVQSNVCFIKCNWPAFFQGKGTNMVIKGKTDQKADIQAPVTADVPVSVLPKK